VFVRALVMLACLSLLSGVLLTEAHAQSPEPLRIPKSIFYPTLPTFPITTNTWLAKAPHDACFYPFTETPGSPPVFTDYNLISDDGPPVDDECTRLSGGQTKVNQAYIWGLTNEGDDIWFSTVANYECLAEGTVLKEVGSGASFLSSPYITPDNTWTCEFGISAWDSLFGNYAGYGDLRPPRIYYYNATDGLIDMTPGRPATTTAGWEPPAIYPLDIGTAGLRFAATLPNGPGGDDMVVFAGPAVNPALGINMFVYDAVTHTYMGSFSLPNYSDIRHAVTYEGSSGSATYIAVANSASNPNIGTAGGSVLMYSGLGEYAGGQIVPTGQPVPTGNPVTCPSCPTFTVVGLLPSEGANIAAHEGRLYVTTWPSLVNSVLVPSGLVMGPVMPSTGVLGASTTMWTTVWSAPQYEPDPVIAAVYAGGALASFDGWVYWGTMHVPYLSTVAAVSKYKPSTQDQALEMVVASQRATAVFRGKNFDTHPTIQLLYGNIFLPQYQPTTKTWKYVRNNMHAIPRYGLSGLNNPFNNYTWSMTVWQNKLWLGTMNWAYVLNETAPLVEEALGMKPGSINFQTLGVGTVIPYGANLAYFSSAWSPARMDDRTGVGNWLNYGIRNMLPVGDTLYLGTANPMNLATSGTFQGGWELRQLQLKKK
jgi:hypothetical protein